MIKRIDHYLILFSILLVFGVSTGFEFLFDDEHFVVNNQFLKSTEYLPKLLTENIVAGAGMKSNLYRPLQSLTHFIDWQLWGANPAFHHLTNVLIHCGLGICFYFVLFSLFTKKVALFGTLFFVLHPLQHFAVAYISGRGDLLGMMFLCLGFLYGKHYWAIAFFILAMMSKESMAFFPFYLMIYEKLKGEKFDYKRYGFYGFVAGSYMLLRLTVLNFNNTMNFYANSNIFTENFHYRVFTFFTSFFKGFSLWFLPYDLHHERFWQVYATFWHFKVIIGFLFFLVVLSCFYFSFRKKQWWTLGLIWFLIAAFPTSNLMVIINALFYDHWYLLPGMGLIFAIAHLFSKVPDKYQYPLTALIIIPYAISTFSYTGVWRNPYTLYEHILKHHPRSAKAMVNLAVAYSIDKNDNKAEEYYLKALEIDPKLYEIYHNLGMISYRRENFQKAITYYRKALAIKPQFFQSKKFMAVCYFYLGEKDLALTLLREIKKDFPYDGSIDRIIDQIK